MSEGHHTELQHSFPWWMHSPFIMLTFGKVVASQQLHIDTHEGIINHCNTFSSGCFVSCCFNASRLNLWLIYVCLKAEGDAQGAHLFPWKLHKVCVATTLRLCFNRSQWEIMWYNLWWRKLNMIPLFTYDDWLHIHVMYWWLLCVHPHYLFFPWHRNVSWYDSV